MEMEPARGRVCWLEDDGKPNKGRNEVEESSMVPKARVRPRTELVGQLEGRKFFPDSCVECVFVPWTDNVVLPLHVGKRRWAKNYWW